MGDALTYDLTRAAREETIAPTVGRDEEIAELIEMLRSDEGKCVLLVGQRGIGKRALVQGLAAKAANDPHLSDLSILELNVGRLFSDTVRVSDMAQDLLASLQEHPSQILYIDPCIPFIDPSEPGSKLIGVYSDAIRSGAIRVIATLDLAEYVRVREAVPSVFETFSELKLEPLTKEDVSIVLESLRPEIQSKHGVMLSSSALDAAIELSRQYLSDQGLPGIAVEVLEKACERYRRKSSIQDIEEDWLDLTSMNMMGKKVSAHDVKRVVEDMAALDIDADQVAAWTRKVYTGLKKSVFAQDEAIKQAAEAQAKAILRLGASGRPSGAFLFIGPRGVGKTHAAQALAHLVARSKNDVFTFDMSQHLTNAGLCSLFGYTPSTGGSVRGSEFDNAVKGAPIAFILLENIEHAHQDAFDALQQILDTGLLMDPTGGKIKFRRCVLILLASYPDSLEPPRNASPEKLLELASNVVPERICNSADAIVPFVPLSRKNVEEFIRHRVQHYIKMLERQDVTLRVDSSIYGLVTKPGAGHFTGVPELKNTIRRTIRMPINDALKANEPRAGLTLYVEADKGKVVVDVTRPKKSKP